MAGGIELPISALPNMFWSMRYEIKHCHAGELFCRVFAHIAAVFFSMLGSNASIEVDIDLFNGFVRLQQLIVHNILLIPSNTDHKLGAMDIRLCRGC